MNYKFKTKPYAHQTTALEKSWNKKVFAYFMEMGTGKTKVAIDNIAMLYDNGKINGALIIAPKGVYKNWYSQEIPEHLADHIQPTTVLWFTKHHEVKHDANEYISRYYFLDDFVCLRKLLDFHGKYWHLVI